MYICEIAFIVILVSPLNLLMTMRIDSRSVPHLWKKIYGQIANIKKKVFQITRVKVDPESGLTSLSNLFANKSIELTSVGVGQLVVEVERRIKERCRGIVNTLPYRLCKKLLESMVYYVTKRINMEPTSVNNFGPSA